jgi:hypothetical protein
MLSVETQTVGDREAGAVSVRELLEPYRPRPWFEPRASERLRGEVRLTEPLVHVERATTEPQAKAPAKPKRPVIRKKAAAASGATK